MAPQPDVDVRAVRVGRDRSHVGAEPLEHRRRDVREGAVGAVDGDPHAGQVGAEMLHHVLDVTADRVVGVLDRA